MTKVLLFVFFGVLLMACNNTPNPGFANKALDAINAARAQGRTCGTTNYAAAPALRWNAQLASAAQGHANDMASNNYFSHTSKDGRNPGARIAATGYKAATWGENIAAGQPDIDAVMAAWIASAGHCANLMGTNVTEVGMALATSSAATYGSHWVQNFGKPQ